MMDNDTGNAGFAIRRLVLMIKVNNWLKIIQQWVYPPICLLCGDPGHGDRDLCRGCFRSLPLNSDACYRCGIPFNTRVNDTLLCGICLTKPPAFDRSQSLFLYQGPVRYLIRQLKYHQNLASARVIGELMAPRLATIERRPELLIPVPLHPRRMRQRGFNQATEIAKPIAKTLNIPLNLTSCQRIRDTTPQFDLPAKQRRKNLAKAFAVKNPIPAEHVAIIDDVVTTTATVNELAKLLRKSGIKRIEIWSFARA